MSERNTLQELDVQIDQAIQQKDTQKLRKLSEGLAVLEKKQDEATANAATLLRAMQDRLKWMRSRQALIKQAMTGL